MASWVVGDIHGCADELARLLDDLRLAPAERLIAVGDLFHRGPDPLGVLELLRAAGALFVLGNHEHAVLRRTGLAPERADALDRPPARLTFPPLDAEDLAGDAGRPLVAPRERLGEILRFLQAHSGYYLEHAAIPGAAPTSDGRAWCVVHAGTTPGREPRDSAAADLILPARAGRARRGSAAPFWFEEHAGPTLILFGHLVFDAPHAVRRDGKLVALGLDTGCVYGGRLSAYSPERDELRSVAAARAYVTRG
jgi:hypothetical protein